MHIAGNGGRRQGIGFGIMLFALLCCGGAQGFAAENLECPEIGPGQVPDLIGDGTGAGLTGTENFIDLANEINDAIGRLQIVSPGISWASVQDVLIAAYCRVVSREPGLSSTEKWSRMRQFTGGARSRGRQDVLRRPDHRACSPSSRCLPGAQEPSRSLPPDGRPIDDRDPGARSREMNRETHNDYSRTAAIPAAEKNLPTSGYCYRQPTPAQSLQAAKSC